ncbi:MAG: hypothetical protein ACI81F_001883 [Thalassolituus oleivorans]|jgi:hypothetical protein
MKLKIKKIHIGLRWLVTIVLTVFGATLIFKKARNDQQFQPQYERLPSVTIEGDRIEVKNFRDLRHLEDGSIGDFNYSDKHYALSELDSVWFGLSHFGDFGLAHAFVSFGFNGKEDSNNYLAVSIEARLRQDQKNYSPIKGLLRNYTKTIVLASEHDIIGARSHIRDEDVYLYKLDIQGLEARALLLNFLRKAEHLNQHPAFYNTLTDNCLTGLISETGLFDSFYQWLDYRITLPGYSDALLQEYQNNKVEYSLEKLRADALVNTKGYTLDDIDFSNKIRGEL